MKYPSKRENELSSEYGELKGWNGKAGRGRTAHTLKRLRAKAARRADRRYQDDE